MIATESKQKQYEIFKVYRFAANWIYGLSAVGFYVLLSPLIQLWLGKDWLLGDGIIALVILDYYFRADRIVMANFKTAAGVFEQDRYLPLAQGAVNLIISILLVQKMGLIGVYIGTVISGIMANIIKPFIVYKVCFNRNASDYFIDNLKYLGVMALVLAIILPISWKLLVEVSIVSFAIVGILIILVYNVILLLFFRKTDEFRYLYEIIRRKF